MQASFLLRCVSVTAAEGRALWLAMVCCVVPEAAVAALALRHPCHALALSNLQLALTVVRHYMYARAVCILLAADPGYPLTLICIGSISTFFARDVTTFILIDILHGGEE